MRVTLSVRLCKSGNDIGKKAAERIELDPFQGSLSICNERALTVVSSRENPDFICERLTGNEVSVEMTKNGSRRKRCILGNVQAIWLADHSRE
jgi:hypothetical protein